MRSTWIDPGRCSAIAVCTTARRITPHCLETVRGRRAPATTTGGRHRRRRAAGARLRYGPSTRRPASSSSRWPTAATTPADRPARRTSSSGASSSRPRRATCTAASRSAGRSCKSAISRLAGLTPVLVRPRSAPRRDELVQGVRRGVRPRGRHRVRRRLRDRDRAGRQGAPAPPPGRRVPTIWLDRVTSGSRTSRSSRGSRGTSARYYRYDVRVDFARRRLPTLPSPISIRSDRHESGDSRRSA